MVVAQPTEPGSSDWEEPEEEVGLKETVILPRIWWGLQIHQVKTFPRCARSRSEMSKALFDVGVTAMALKAFIK